MVFKRKFYKFGNKYVYRKGVITFANASVVRADSIMVYSDIIQLDGAIENAVETQEGGRQILGSCIKGKSPKLA